MDQDIKDVFEAVIFMRVEHLPTEDRVREIVREKIAEHTRWLDAVEEHYRA